MNIAIPEVLKIWKRQNRLPTASTCTQHAHQPGDPHCPCHTPTSLTYQIARAATVDAERDDWLSRVHRNASPLSTARKAASKANEHWHVNKYVQTYKPKETSRDRTVEVYYEELGLGVVEQTTVLPTNTDFID